MTPEQVRELYSKALHNVGSTRGVSSQSLLEFARLIANEVREECAVVARQTCFKVNMKNAGVFAAATEHAIRATKEV